MREVVVLGVGLHPWGIFDQTPLLDMAIQATTKLWKMPVWNLTIFKVSLLADLISSNFLGAACWGMFCLICWAVQGLMLLP